METIDHIDIQLLKLLQKNNRLTTKEMAQQVNLSPTPVFERIKRLENEGYIKKHIAILDPDKLNRGFCVFCNIRLKQHNKEIGLQFMDAIQNINEITECYNISGDYDFMIKIYVQSMKHYQDFVLNTLGTIDSIGNIHSIFVLGEIKQTYSVPL